MAVLLFQEIYFLFIIQPTGIFENAKFPENAKIPIPFQVSGLARGKGFEPLTFWSVGRSMMGTGGASPSFFPSTSSWANPPTPWFIWVLLLLEYILCFLRCQFSWTLSRTPFSNFPLFLLFKTSSHILEHLPSSLKPHPTTSIIYSTSKSKKEK